MALFLIVVRPMARPPRLTAPSTVYHVIVRCNNKEHLFKTPKDFESLLCVLAHYKKKHAFNSDFRAGLTVTKI